MGELKPTKGLSGRAFFVGLLLVLIWLLYDCTLAVDPALAAIELLYLVGFGAMFTLFLVQTVNSWLPESRRLSKQELTVVYAMVAVAIPWGILIRGALEAPIKMIVVHTAKSDQALGWVTTLWTPKARDAIEDFRRGGIMPWQIRWDVWRAPILYWSAMLVSFQVFAISTVLLFRRVFIDQEKLPFPMAQVGQSLIEYRPSKSEETSARRLRSAVRTAFFLGFLMCLPGIVGFTPSTQQPIPMNTSYYGTQTGIVPGVWTSLSWDPFVLCFLMLFPLDVLLTAVLFHLGLYVGIPVLFHWLAVPLPPRILADFRNILLVGGISGLAFWPVFFNRKTIRDAIKRAWRGERSPSSSNPFSDRVIVIAMASSFTAFLILFVYGMGDISGDVGRHVISLIWCVAILLVVLIATMRMKGEQGWHYHSPWTIAFLVSYVHYYYMIKPRLYNTQASFLTIGHVVQFGAYHNVFAPHLHVLDSLKIASQTETSARDVIKAVLVTLLISMLLVVPGYLMLIHYYGFEHGTTSAYYENFWNYQLAHHDIGHNLIPRIFSRIPPWISVPIGMGIVGFLTYMKREHVGFPLNPVGVVVAVGLCFIPGSYGTSAIWFPMIIVFVAKYLVFRWYGVNFFRRNVIPVVVFAIMGLMTGMFVYKILMISLGRGFVQPY